jgi:DNA invertase Pin-like site-specific DNA recombinase
MASLAQMKRELLVARTRAGLVAAKKLGRVGGRKRRMTESKIQSGKTLLISGVSPKEVARNLGVLFRRFIAGCLHPNALSGSLFPLR